MNAPAPDSWEATRSRVTALIARRAAVLDETAAAWARFARGQGWTAGDLDAFWEGVTEDVVRRLLRAPVPDGTDARTVREDVLATMTALRDRIRKALA